MRAAATFLALTLLGPTACDDTAKATEAVTKAAQGAADRTQTVVDASSKRVDEVAKRASDAAGKAASDALDTAKTAVNDTAAASKRAWAGLTNTGELSQDALTWMQDTAESTDMRAVVAKGVQVAPVAYEIGKTINAAVDSDTAIEPIYQPLEGRDPAEVDRTIGSMPRVEVVDGIKIGFRQLSRTDAGASVDERAYLVTWRRDDHLVGMVYRTKRTIDLDLLVAEAPRLIALTRTVLAAETP